MTARDILNVADSLITGSHEADWRSAVSRAYYAAFHAARELLRQCGFDVPRAEQDHGYLWLRLANSGHLDMRMVGFELNALRQARNWADYDLDREFEHAPAVGRVQLAETVFGLLQAAAGEEGVRAQITEGMKIYERDVLRQVTWRA